MPDVEAKAQVDPATTSGAAGSVATEQQIPPRSLGDEASGTAHPPSVAPALRNPIFSELVQGEEDLPGLVGYALYKLSKRDWLAAFVKIHGREPTQDEIDSFILGERTQRRVATYRRLAEELISRKTSSAEKPAPSLPPASVPEPSPQRITPVKGNSLRSSLASEDRNSADARPAAAKEKARGSGATTLIFWLLVLVVLAGVAWIYFNYPNLLHMLTG